MTRCAFNSLSLGCLPWPMFQLTWGVSFIMMLLRGQLELSGSKTLPISCLLKVNQMSAQLVMKTLSQLITKGF